MTVPALWLEHRPLARSIARDYFLPGAEPQDVEQEALIGLWEASRDFNGYGTFKQFAAMVIRRRLQTCVKHANREKHKPLTGAARNSWAEDGEPRPILDTLPHLHQVADLAEDHEQIRAVLASIARDLTPIERQAVIGIASGLSYAEIGLPFKQIDNALARARRKLRAAA